MFAPIVPRIFWASWSVTLLMLGSNGEYEKRIKNNNIEKLKKINPEISANLLMMKVLYLFEISCIFYWFNQLLT